MKYVAFLVIVPVILMFASCSNDKSNHKTTPLINDSDSEVLDDAESIPADDDKIVGESDISLADNDAPIIPDEIVDADNQPEPDESVDPDIIKKDDDIKPAPEDNDIKPTPDDDENPLIPDEDTKNPLDECEVHKDCDFGSKCDTTKNPTICTQATNCKTDADCSKLQSCKLAENWKECSVDFTPSQCKLDEDCGFGGYCEIVALEYGICKSKNECSINAECEEYFECKPNDEFMACQEIPQCASDEECGFGFACTPKDSKKFCTYANECKNDIECGNLQRCLPDGNHNKCQMKLSEVCTKDEQCKTSDMFCDLSLGVVGSCKSRNQCNIDLDCGEGMLCQSNDTYNECVQATTEKCALDMQCEDGFSCINGTCSPGYTGMCPEIEGFWKVFFSTQMFLQANKVYEFIPKEGCSGNIQEKEVIIPVGTFAQSEPKKYSIKIALFTDCTADINLGGLLSITCGDQTAQMIRE